MNFLRMHFQSACRNALIALLKSRIISGILLAFWIVQAQASPYVLDASTYAGSNAGQKISAALADLQSTIASRPSAPAAFSGPTGGIIDGRSLSGDLTIATPITLGSAFNYSVTLLLGAGTYTVHGTINLVIQSSIVGQVDGQGNPTTILKAADNKGLWAVVMFGDGTDWKGGNTTLRNVIVDGNAAGGGTASSSAAAAVLIHNSGNISIVNTTIQNSAGQGLYSRFLPSGAGTAGQLYLRKVRSWYNAFSGYRGQNTSDNFFYESTFSNNGADGLELGESPTLRMSNSVVDKNQRNGLYAYAPSSCTWCGLLIIVNNAFSNNCNSGVAIVGSNSGVVTNGGNLIANNSFTGGSCSPGQAAIFSSGGRGNMIVNNTVATNLAVRPHLWTYGVQLSSSVGKSSVASNTLSGGAVYSLTPGVDVLTTTASSAFSNAPLVADTPSLPQPPVNTGALPNGIDASTQAGSTAGQKISAALTALYAKLSANGLSSGIIDARGLAGAQRIDTSLQIGNSTKSVALFLGTGVYTVENTIYVAQNSSINGTPTGNTVNTTYDSPGTALKAGAQRGLWAVVSLGISQLGDGDYSAIRDVFVDGNRANGGTVASTVSAAILVNGARQVTISDTTAMNSGGQGIFVRNNHQIGGGNVWSHNLLNRVMSIANAQSGLKVQNVEGAIAVQSQFELNTLDGVELDTAPKLLAILADFGGNKRFGLNSYAQSACTWCGQAIVAASQFGNNDFSGINVWGSAGGIHTAGGNRFAGNSFISGAASAGISAIVLQQNANSQISGNVISTRGFSSPRVNWDRGIYLPGSTGGNWIAGNMVDGAVTGSPYILGTSGVDTVVENENTVP